MGRWDKNDNGLLSMIAQFVSPKSGHQRVHEGVAFSSEVFRGEGSHVADNTSVIMGFKTEGLSPHLVLDMACGGDFEFQMIEGASVTIASTLVPYNRKRTSGTTAVSSVTVASTTANGTTIMRSTFPGGTKPFTVGGAGDAFNQEWNLKTSTQYAFVATNRAGSAQPLTINAFWYEPED